MRLGSIVKVMHASGATLQIGKVLEIGMVDGMLKCKVFCSKGKHRPLANGGGWADVTSCKVLVR